MNIQIIEFECVEKPVVNRANGHCSLKFFRKTFGNPLCNIVLHLTDIQQDEQSCNQRNDTEQRKDNDISEFFDDKTGF